MLVFLAMRTDPCFWVPEYLGEVRKHYGLRNKQFVSVSAKRCFDEAVIFLKTSRSEESKGPPHE